MNSIKKLLSVLLAALLLCCVWTPAFAGLDGNYAAPIPTVYLQGQGSTLYANKDDTKSAKIQDVEIPDGYIGDAAKGMIGPLLKGLNFNQWDEWCELLTDAVAKLYEPQALDENGEASNGSGIYFSSGNANRKNKDGTYNIGCYTPAYDWRLDPCAIADDVHTYVKQVKSATKAKKVNIMGRSIGASVLLAYLEKYGMDDIDTAVIYCPSFYGMEVFSRAFAGRLDIDTAAVKRFTEYYVNSGKADGLLGDENDSLLRTLSAFVSRAIDLHAMDIPVSSLERIYTQVYGKVYPMLLVKMYGSMPSFWSLVGDEDYARAKELIFGGQEDTYAGLIEKIDNFHYNVLDRAEDRITELTQAGHKIQIVVKSGVPMVPVVADAACNGDMLTTVWSATAGATCAPVGQTFDTVYRMNAARRDALDYISPNNDIDASTGLLPDHTWFIDKLEHRSMPESVNALFEAILNFDGYMNVFDDEAFPQYLVYDQEADLLTPAVAQEPAPSQQSRLQAFFARIRAFFSRIAAFFRNIFRAGA